MGIIKYLLEGLSKSIHVNHLASSWQIVSNQYMVAIVIISQALIFFQECFALIISLIIKDAIPGAE